jgi:hypothetical protein
MLVQLRGSVLQFLNPECAYGLNDVGANALEGRFVADWAGFSRRHIEVLTKWCFHLRVSFFDIKTQNNNLCPFEGRY